MSIEYLRLAAVRPANTTEVELYEVPAVTEMIADLMICNQSAIPATFRVAHTDVDGAAAGEDWLAYDEVLQGNSRTVIHITAGPAETVRIKAGTADVISFVLAGMLRT